ncbi:hypothetical protein KOR42_12990 [Thalassoglobus neptunius]|uniref:DUF2752 domain-containing protein n=2 Tax=Thalassoglobus neptunius TaxID=1938619 RepID=A0A5C5X6G3_9PLAN|nr:hypothetical protein KOR42_12990 [Thalassoglobus neptunius]
MRDSKIPSFPLTFPLKILLILAELGILFGFGLAASVEPDPRGYGTHQQFGLPPCTIQTLFGVNCPSCGGTTSVSNFVRGRWITSAKANLAVFLLSLVCLAFLPWAMISLRSGTLFRVEDPTKLALFLMIVITSVALLQWTARLISS